MRPSLSPHAGGSEPTGRSTKAGDSSVWQGHDGRHLLAAQGAQGGLPVAHHSGSAVAAQARVAAGHEHLRDSSVHADHTLPSPDLQGRNLRWARPGSRAAGRPEPTPAGLPGVQALAARLGCWHHPRTAGGPLALGRAEGAQLQPPRLHLPSAQRHTACTLLAGWAGAAPGAGTPDSGGAGASGSARSA